MAHTPKGETREKVYRFVRDRLLGGAAPTVREVQAAMGFAAVESARKQLDLLVTEGRLVKEPGISRGYRLPAQRNEVHTAQVPLLGTVQAGRLQQAIEHPDGWVLVETRKRSDELFALRVRGESMIGAGILPGDIAIVRRGPVRESGAIVVALVGDEATVKTLRLRRNRVVLEPANPAFEAIVPDPDSLEILGRVVEVRRRLD
ncbi:MAG: transcriptional repressor LexA [Planctomycetota bacterium]